MLLQGILSLSLAADLASAINLTVSSTGGNVTSPLMYGLVFEDINNSGDGGIYAELIQNRAFQGSAQYPSTLSPWTAVGDEILTLQNTTVQLSNCRKPFQLLSMLLQLRSRHLGRLV
jgi:alpha-L-arabinofuranosidase